MSKPHQAEVESKTELKFSIYIKINVYDAKAENKFKMLHKMSP